MMADKTRRIATFVTLGILAVAMVAALIAREVTLAILVLLTGELLFQPKPVLIPLLLCAWASITRAPCNLPTAESAKRILAARAKLARTACDILKKSKTPRRYHPTPAMERIRLRYLEVKLRLSFFTAWWVLAKLDLLPSQKDGGEWQDPETYLAQQA